VGGVWEATFDLAAFGARVENLTTDQRDVNRQRQILTDLLDADFAVIGVAPAHASAHPSALDDLISEHRRCGTAAVTLHGDAPQSKRSTFVGAYARPAERRPVKC